MSENNMKADFIAFNGDKMAKRIYIPIYLRPLLGIFFSVALIIMALAIAGFALIMPIAMCFQSHLAFKQGEKNESDSNSKLAH